MEHFIDSKCRVVSFTFIMAMKAGMISMATENSSITEEYNHENVFRFHKKDYTNMREQISLIDSEFFFIDSHSTANYKVSRHISVFYILEFEMKCLNSCK